MKVTGRKVELSTEENNLVHQFMTCLGELTFFFSNMEYSTTAMLARLVDGSEGAVAAEHIVQELNLVRSAKHIRDIASFRFGSGSELTQALERFAKELDEIRVVRNTLIHGLWEFSLISEGKIRVLDMRWRRLSRASATAYSIEEFRALRDRAEQLALNAGRLMHKVETTDFMEIKTGPYRRSEPPTT